MGETFISVFQRICRNSEKSDALFHLVHGLLIIYYILYQCQHCVLKISLNSQERKWAIRVSRSLSVVIPASCVIVMQVFWQGRVLFLYFSIYQCDLNRIKWIWLKSVTHVDRMLSQSLSELARTFMLT